jgi:hypothetical protein
MSIDYNDGQHKLKIVGQGRSLKDAEAEAIAEMIQEAQRSSRNLYIPEEDLAEGATTHMAGDVARIVAESRVRQILNLFNRDFLYGQGRFDEYARGLILKWGDGYSRKHIWVSVENGQLLFEKSHGKRCEKPYCTGTHHVFSRAMWLDTALVNEELGDCFRRPVYERTDD